MKPSTGGEKKLSAVKKSTANQDDMDPGVGQRGLGST